MSEVDPAPLAALLEALLDPSALVDWLYTLRKGEQLIPRLQGAPTPASVAALLADAGRLDGAAFAALGVICPEHLPAIRSALRESGALPRPAPRQPILGLRPARAVYGVGVRDLQDSRGRRRVISRKAEILIDRGIHGVTTARIPYGAILLVGPGDPLPPGGRIAEWDPNMIEVLAEFDGAVRYGDLLPGRTLHRWPSAAVVRSCSDPALQPRVSLVAASGGGEETLRRRWFLPVGAVLEVEDGVEVRAGQVIARVYRTLEL